METSIPKTVAIILLDPASPNLRQILYHFWIYYTRHRPSILLLIGLPRSQYTQLYIFGRLLIDSAMRIPNDENGNATNWYVVCGRFSLATLGLHFSTSFRAKDMGDTREVVFDSDSE
jgi:hypothetical protein